ncbi:MAG TPA: helix-turn-helix domain-containing protein [Actinophytocola sp.]|uniref:PucR family transcriptional regulator n=1 Tax=Actinophytocola sp. TaxID=1872138 RepID=UPI002DC01ABC|nr:helix-turn-helix domain-containing protein [Actinophytocola sp.]HEU5470707.1 helix-turn-helix domain-containing protein [Actinophytocola sp.]
MTQHDLAEARLPFGGVPGHQRLAEAAGELVPRVLERVVAELPAYARLPREELRGDIVRIIERGIQSFVHMLRTGQPPSAGLLAALHDDIVQRAEEGIPVEAVLSAHHIGVQVCWDHFSDQARPEELATVIEVSKLQLRYLRDVTAVVSAGYFQERQRIFTEEHAARQALLSALLAGERITDAAAHAGIPLAPAYVVLGLRVAAHGDEQCPEVDAAVAARRKIRKLRTELERTAGDPVLSRLTPAGGLVVLPAADEDHEPGWARVAKIVLSASHAAGAAITAGAALAAPTSVGPAADIAREVREIAFAAGFPPGVYDLSDVALEFQLSRPGPAREILAALVQPLTRTPELLQTLALHVHCGLNRRRTAKELHVHPNTVDYRLRKIGELTGLDPTHPDQLARIRAALVARQALHPADPPLTD